MFPEAHDRTQVSECLVYVHDPMCSWCWAFRPALQHVLGRLPGDLKVTRIVGGLAPDSGEPMPETMKQHLAGVWRVIEKGVPGTRFNHDFWKVCVPRRSTFPACRAVIAARSQGESWDESITFGIQKAYYLEARNPSDDAVLIEVAESVGLDAERFRSDFYSDRTGEILEQEIGLARSLGISGFPAVLLRSRNRSHPIAVDYNRPEQMVSRICAVLQGR